jgi:tetratricopeptide (TPR) repeat protein
MDVAKRFGRTVLVAALVGLVVSATAVFADETATLRKACEDEDATAESRLPACSKLIANTALSGEIRADAHVARGNIADEAGRYDEAITEFTAALKLVPADPASLVLRGNAYDAKGDKKRALADYDAAIRINPGDASGYFNRATVLEEIGEREKAMADYRKAIEIDPTFERARTNLAELQKK